MSFNEFDPSKVLMILEAQTQGGKPGSQGLLRQIVQNIEQLFMLLGYTGVSGTLTADPPNDTTGWLTDSAATWEDDDHNGHNTLIMDGNGKFHLYTIDDTDETNNRLVHTGDNLYQDGVRSGDAYWIFYDLKSGQAHTHDGINSAVADISAYRPGNLQENNKTSYSVQGDTPDGSYTKLAEYQKLPRGGEITVRMGLVVLTGSGTAYGKVYINGVARGIERSTTSTSYVYFDEDFVVIKGDIVEIWGYCGSGVTYMRARIYIGCDNPLIITGDAW